MSDFENFLSVKKLQELSHNPIDLSKPGVFTSDRIDKMQIEGLGFNLFYGAQRIDEEVEKMLFSLADEANAISKMEKMQNGETINLIDGYESENREVLHTATRDFFENKNSHEKAQEAAKLAYVEIEKLKSFLEKNTQFTDIVQVGIGGSDLGPRALCIALNAYALKNRRAHFISNVDPDDPVSLLHKLDLEKTLIVVVSKSGNTLETLTNESFVRSFLEKKGLTPKDHLISVTGKGSPMDDPSNYLESFYIWDYIGGRYSATSMVGGVALAFLLGIDAYLEILQGASSMDKLALQKDPKKNLPLFSALLGIWNRNFLHLPTLAIIPYSQALLRFTAHLQQCDMESNGKRIDKKGNEVPFQTGPIIWGEPGTNGQHSFYQLIHQGTTPVPIEFIGFKETQYGQDLMIQGTTSQQKLLANLFAQSISLATGQQNENPNKVFPGNRPNSVLLGRKLDPRSMGALLSYYENKVAFQGFIWGVNSFDQEGVQLGKLLASKILDIFKAQNENGKVPLFDQAQSYLKALDKF